jgi:hypothetical protein
MSRLNATRTIEWSGQGLIRSGQHSGRCRAIALGALNSWHPARMTKLVVVLLATLAVVELIVVVVIATVLFMIGTTSSVAVGAAMIVVSLVAGGVALRAVRHARGRSPGRVQEPV